MAVKKIGFDFDKVFVSYPPIVPDFLIDYLYKGKLELKKGTSRKKTKLHYRMPGFFEKQLRILSHHYIFRSPIRNNIESLRLIRKSSNQKLYLISSRFGFLKDKTNIWLDRQKMKKDFDGIHFNFKNIQPHIFKEKTIKHIEVTHYVDDDLDLLLYLSEKLPNIHLFWVTDGKNYTHISFPKNITIIKSIRELYNKHL